MLSENNLSEKAMASRKRETIHALNRFKNNED
jgi:hypothetical protein